MKDKTFWSLLAVVTLAGWNAATAQIVLSTRRTANEPVVQAAPGQPRQPYKVERADGEAGGFFYAPRETTGGLAASSGREQDPVVAELRVLGAQLVAKGARGTWSPDGKRLAVGTMPFGKGVYLVQVVGPDADASAPRIPSAVGQPFGAVTELLSDGKDPAWSPDGKWIAFTREVGSGAGTTEEIWLTAADPVVLGKPAASSRRQLGTGVMATWSADATTVFFTNPQTHAIFSVPVAKPDTVSVWNAIGDRFPDLWYPVVRPDGRYVAYHADGRLKIADMAAGKIVADWPLDGWRGWLGSWSPDGSRLGYGAFGGEDKGLWELPFIFLGTLKLSPPRRILSGSCTLPSWSPDGSKLAFDFRSPQRGYEVWMVDTKRLSAAGVSTTSEVVGPTVRVFRLRHAKAQDVVQEIRRVLPRGGLGADSRVNAIVVSGDAETLKIVAELIEKLDVARPKPAAVAKPSERGEGAPPQKYQRASIGELEQAIAKLQRDLTLAEDKTREAAAAMRQAEQAEKAASGEAKTAALFRKLKAEVAAQRERSASARIKSEFQAACNAYREAITSSGTDDRPDRTPAGKTAGDAERRKPPVTAWPVAAFDGFDGRLDLPWKPIRHDPTHVSLDKHPGKLTITTQRGSIHGKEKQDDYGGGIQAKNLFVIDSPFCNGEDFAMTTCVENFTPQTPYQQAGLICYDDDDDYLKWGYEFCWPKGAGHTFACVREVAAESNFDVADAKPGITKYWLRIIKRGNKYQYAYSHDGADYVTVGEQTWGDGKPKKLGLLAKNGGNPDAPELECQFDFFQLTCPNEGKSINWDRQRGKGADRPPKRDSASTLRPIKLGAKANQDLKKSFNEDGPDNSLAELPQGSQELGGVKFEIGPGCIRLRGNQRPKLPQAVEGIPVGFCFDKLHLLHATEFGAFGDESHPFFVKDGTHIGDYKVHYADGSTATIPIVYGEDVRDWWNWDKSKETKRGKVVWTGKSADAGQYDVALRLYLTTWDNPKPAVQVTTIDYVSAGQTAAGPFCVAMTAHTAETRADPSPAASSEKQELPVVTAYHLKHASAEAIAKELTTSFAGQNNCRFVADARKNVVIAFGTAEQQKKIQETIRSRDVPGTPFGRDVEEGMMIDAIEDNLPDSRTP